MFHSYEIAIKKSSVFEVGKITPPPLPNFCTEGKQFEMGKISGVIAKLH